MKRRIRIRSNDFCYSPGFFRWVREAVAPFDVPKAKELLIGLGLPEADSETLSDPKHPVVTSIVGEDLLLEFELKLELQPT